MMAHSRIKNARIPSTRRNCRLISKQNVWAKLTALSTSTISTRNHSTTRTTSQRQKMATATDPLLNSSFSTPASNQVLNKRRSMMRSANKLLSSCLLLSFSSWSSTILNRQSSLTKRSMMSILLPLQISLLSLILPRKCGITIWKLFTKVSEKTKRRRVAKSTRQLSI